MKPSQPTLRTQLWKLACVIALSQATAAKSVEIDEFPLPPKLHELPPAAQEKVREALEKLRRDGQEHVEKFRRENLKMMLGNVPVYRVPEGAIRTARSYTASDEPQSECATHSFESVPLSALGLAGAKVMRTDWDSPMGCQDRLGTRVRRIIVDPSDRLVSLTEWDFVTEGGAVGQSSTAINGSLDGIPSVLAGLSDDTGASCWKMT